MAAISLLVSLIAATLFGAASCGKAASSSSSPPPHQLSQNAQIQLFKLDSYFELHLPAKDSHEPNVKALVEVLEDFNRKHKTGYNYSSKFIKKVKLLSSFTSCSAKVFDAIWFVDSIRPTLSSKQSVSLLTKTLRPLLESAASKCDHLHDSELAKELSRGATSIEAVNSFFPNLPPNLPSEFEFANYGSRTINVFNEELKQLSTSSNLAARQVLDEKSELKWLIGKPCKQYSDLLADFFERSAHVARYATSRSGRPRQTSEFLRVRSAQFRLALLRFQMCQFYFSKQ